jgi:hypothetical protein
MLTKATPDFHVSDVADWSDEKLYQVIEAVTDRFVKKSVLITICFCSSWASLRQLHLNIQT